MLAAVAGVFGDHGVSIRSMEQEGLGDEARLIFITHTRARARRAGDPARPARARRRRPRRVACSASSADAVKYVCTRGEAPVLGFADVLLAGLARDGGLYVPEYLPVAARRSRRRPTTPTLAAEVMAPFVDGVPRPRRRHVDDAYATFDHPDVVPARRPRRRRLAARAVPRADARLQGRRPPARRPAVRRRAAAGGASGARSSSPPRATPARPPSRPASGGDASTSSCSTRPAGSARCSAGR